RKFSSPLDPDAFLSNSQVGTLALAFFDDDLKFRAFFRAIQNSRNSDVLSAPKMAVLNGHRAVIDTGARIPVQTPVLGASGQLTQVQVKFEETGVKLIVTPYLLMDDMIQIDVTADVSFVSSFVESGASGILNPVISQRTASTVVNVRDGQTFGIGGLIATDQIELVTKIPILGDIPILGYLFKTKSVTEQQSQVIFFITPRIVRPFTPLLDPGV
ncbi:MAG: type II secretion system protein GspD, partial [Planctomycetota bacterium JB042]